jgi:hypothetical protein
MTRGEFDEQLGRLVVLKGMPGDSDPYWDALRDIPLDVFRLAIDHAIRTRAWFPVPAELRLDADTARPSRRSIAEHPTSYKVPLQGAVAVQIANPFGGAPINVQVTDDLRRHCETCEDTGWAKWWCGKVDERPRWPWMIRRHCGRRNEHGTHDWTEPCVCAQTNPIILRRKEMAAARFSTEPEKVA